MLGIPDKDAMAGGISLSEVQVGEIPFSGGPEGFQMLGVRSPKFGNSGHGFS